MIRVVFGDGRHVDVSPDARAAVGDHPGAFGHRALGWVCEIQKWGEHVAAWIWIPEGASGTWAACRIEPREATAARAAVAAERKRCLDICTNVDPHDRRGVRQAIYDGIVEGE